MDKKDYLLVCNALKEYLAAQFVVKDQIGLGRRMEKTPAGQLLSKVTSYENIIYSFNYTPIHLIISAIYGHESLEPKRIHGNIEEKDLFHGDVKDNSIILGIESEDLSQIAPNYTFMIKSNNSKYRSSSIASDLMGSQNVIFFGHSLNQMDFGYFKDYFKMLTKNVDRDRKLTIITKDEQSRITLLDNIRKEGICVRDIFAHTYVEFVLTTKLNDKNSSDKKVFEELINSVQNV